MAKNIQSLYGEKIKEYSNLNAQTKMVFLQGLSRTGKSTVLGNLITELKKTCNQIIDEKIYPKNGNQIDDIIIVLKCGDIKIGINTFGDYAGIIDKGMEIFNEKECDVIFGAMRTKGETVEYVELLKNITNQVCIIKKMSTEYSLALQNKIDQEQLNILLTLI